jgi:hypothetical protein
MADPGVLNKPFFVQFAERDGGEWFYDLKGFATEAEAVAHMRHLITDEGRFAARVLKIVAYGGPRYWLDED